VSGGKWLAAHNYGIFRKWPESRDPRACMCVMGISALCQELVEIWKLTRCRCKVICWGRKRRISIRPVFEKGGNLRSEPWEHNRCVKLQSPAVEPCNSATTSLPAVIG
jgi:hypothetical protein